MVNHEIKNFKPLRELVYDEIKKQILTGDFTPGMRMKEADISDMLGVSRTPVREALHTLAKEGLILSEPRKGFYVTEISSKTIVNTLEVRLGLETVAASCSAERINFTEIEQLREYQYNFEKAAEAENIDEMRLYDNLFHALIVESSRNKFLITLYEHLAESMSRFRIIYFKNESRAKTVAEEHGEILKYIAAGDAAGAEEAMITHISRLKKPFLE